MREAIGMNNPPALSVLTPVFNGERFVERCYRNLPLQNFQDWEWIIVDDGSRDRTLECATRIEDPRVKVVSYSMNKGRGFARTRGMESASGEWIVIWDIDDMYFPDRLEKINQARIEGFDYFCSYAIVCDNDIHIKGVRGFHPPAEGKQMMFVHTTLACRADLAREIGYDPVYVAGEDYTMIVTLASRHHGWFCDEALAINQEDREVNLTKAIQANRSQFIQFVRMRNRGTLRINRLIYAWYCLRWKTKIAVLHLMRFYPDLYLKTVSIRSNGVTRPGWTLSKERENFVAKMRELDASLRLPV